MHAVRYAFEEAIKSLWRGRQAGLLSTVTIALALFVLGGFLLVTTNLERLGREWGSAAELSVYLLDQVTTEERAVIERELAPGGVVVARDYLSKTDALARFRQLFGDMSAALERSGENPLPASYEVRLRSGPTTLRDLDALAARVRPLGGVADVRYDRQWLERLLSAIGVIRTAGLALGAVLGFAAALTVANVVRLALHARRDEIQIMRLVGAPETYVRGPFIMEGVLQGGVGAAAALLGLTLAFLALKGPYLAPLAVALGLPAVDFLPTAVSVSLVVGGMAVGCLGGLVAAWRS